MGKKSKVQGPSIDWYSVGIVVSKYFMAFFMILLGLNMASESGERVYNMYMHSVRKMIMPSTKPGDASPIGMTWNELNKIFIIVMGFLSCVAGVLIFAGKNCVAGLLLILTTAFMAATKDNHWIKSDVPAIKRESGVRLEHMCRDLSLLGVCLMMISGFSRGRKISDKVAPEKPEEEN